ncbi:DUF624 domain-containing protein [Bacillaceae bacterium Marseille-Q3522]|nr:DUF624 domain-containing protein [Bacillaceae bacterium Marseille-Q3522]
MVQINKFMQICDWIYRLLYLNALWVLFTLAGLLVLGLFPATVSMFYITKEWLDGKKDLPIFKTYLTKYKEEFFRSQLLGVIITVVAFLFIFDLLFLFQQEGTIFYMLRFAALSAVFMFVILLPFLFPLYVRERLPFKEYFKYVLLISITRIFHSLIMTAGCMTIFIVFARFAGFFLFFFGSTVACWLTWNVKTALSKIQQKHSIYR